MLLAVTVMVTLGIWVTGNLANAATAIGFIAARVGGLDISPALPVWLTPLSATLVHGDFLHLLFNMALLYYCGRQIEAMIGPGPLIMLYLVGAFAAAVGQYALGPTSVMPAIGASGAVSAVIGAYAVSFGKPKRIVASLRLNRWLNIAWLMAAWVVLQLIMTYVSGQLGLLIAVGAHIGGFIAGVALQRPLLLWRYRRA
ncbi:MAG: rhomboid family intramembrane serine protease [Pseudomonadota bacterium]